MQRGVITGASAEGQAGGWASACTLDRGACPVLQLVLALNSVQKATGLTH